MSLSWSDLWPSGIRDAYDSNAVMVIFARDANGPGDPGGPGFTGAVTDELLSSKKKALSNMRVQR